MTIERSATSCLTAMLLFGAAHTVYSDSRDREHIHVGGGLSHSPYVMTMQTWFPNIVYDETAGNTHQTSLDIYTDVTGQSNVPVMIFVHGGGYRVGDKASTKDLDPKPEYFVSKLDYILVSINYRLLPEGRYPTNVQDVANAIAWVAKNIAEFGGDPDQLFLMGHSAGAGLVAQVTTDETFLENAGTDLDVIKGVIANEGSYGFETDENFAKNQESLFGENWRDVVAIAMVTPGKNIPPFLLFHVTGKETLVAGSALQAIEMGTALKAAGVRADVIALDHVEHFGANERIGEPGDITTVSVERFLDSIAHRETPATWKAAEF